ncbi:ubiquinone biosynthesis regulatory protein kinase UbiB, partial [Francisella tularensis subsp. holarctica]|nr:ubiquinone biosynthesis regulatory protein kinase UbiB [Francisella tularensis subsp. holarctica]
TSTQFNNLKEPKKKYRFALGFGLVLTTIGVIYNLNKDTTPLIKLQNFISNYSTSFIIFGVACLIYYSFKKEK